MNNVCNFRNNVLHCINETKIPSKIIINSNNRPKETISIFYKANKISNYKVLSENKNNNQRIKYKPISLKFNTNKKFNTISIERYKRYDNNFLPRKNIMHIKTLTSFDSLSTSKKNSSKNENTSISYTTPKKIIKASIIRSSKYNKSEPFNKYDFEHERTVCSSSIKLTKNIFASQKNIKKENLYHRFIEENKTGRKRANHSFLKVKINLDKSSFNKYHTISISKEEEKFKEIKNKKEKREKETRKILKNVKKRRCNMCNQLINDYLFTAHYSSHPSQILPGIYLGNYINANNLEEIRRLRINYILNCASDIKINNLPTDLKYCHLDMIDSPQLNIFQYFGKAFAFIESARKNNCNILIHCKLGISRSTSILIAYMIKHYGYSVKKSLDLIKSKRKQVNPNNGFINQLYSFERYIANSSKNNFYYKNHANIKGKIF
jgi:protein-tyrosine phosphatase